jgi:hypothetical protein
LQDLLQGSDKCLARGMFQRIARRARMHGNVAQDFLDDAVQAERNILRNGSRPSAAGRCRRATRAQSACARPPER